MTNKTPVQVSFDEYFLPSRVTAALFAINTIAMFACAVFMWSTASDMRQVSKQISERADSGCIIREEAKWSACFVGGKVYQMRNDGGIEVKQ